MNNLILNMSFGLLIKLILAFVIISYLWKKVGKFFVNVFSNNTSRAYSNASNQHDRKVHVESDKNGNKKKFTAGDYVEFEEID